MSCSDKDCKVTYWRDVVDRGFNSMRRGWCTADGSPVARDERDARLALASAELVCKAFHKPALNSSALNTAKSAK